MYNQTVGSDIGHADDVSLIVKSPIGDRIVFHRDALRMRRRLDVDPRHCHRSTRSAGRLVPERSGRHRAQTQQNIELTSKLVTGRAVQKEIRRVVDVHE